MPGGPGMFIERLARPSRDSGSPATSITVQPVVAERHEALATQIRAIVREELKTQHTPRRDELETLAQHVARVERQVIPLEEVPAR